MADKSGKLLAREYLQDRVNQHKPPPSEREIRRAMGWDLIAAQRDQDVRQAVIAYARSAL